MPAEIFEVKGLLKVEKNSIPIRCLIKNKKLILAEVDKERILKAAKDEYIKGKHVSRS